MDLRRVCISFVVLTKFRRINVNLHSQFIVKLSKFFARSHILDCMIYNCRFIRKYFDQDSMKTIMHVCITSKLDYCNSLLYGLPDSTNLQSSKMVKLLVMLLNC